MNINIVFIFLVLGCFKVESYVMDLSNLSTSDFELWCHLCNMPLLAIYSEEVLTPTYYFSLEKGGRISGNIKVVSAESVNSNLVVYNNSSNSSDDNKITRKRNFIFRKRIIKRNSRNNHYNWLYLFHILFNRSIPISEDVSPPLKDLQISEDGSTLLKDVQTSEDTTVSSSQDNTILPQLQYTTILPLGDDKELLDDIYLILLTQNQWELYLTSNPLNTIQPSKNKRGYIHYNNIISKLRIPITKIGDDIKFEFESDTSDRYILILINLYKRELILNGKIIFMNPSSKHLPIEMIYHYNIFKFWIIIFITTTILTLLYLILLGKFNIKPINYMLSFNYLFYSLFLYMDMNLIKSLNDNGTYSEILWALCHLLKRFHEIYFLLLLVLLSFGWNILREHLSLIEFQLISSVCLISIFMGFIEIIINGFDISRYLIHAIACVCILVAINFNSVIINSRISDEGLTLQAGIGYTHMRIYSKFRIFFFTYILKPVIFSTIKLFCLQSSIDRITIWDEHVNLFLNITFDFILHTLLYTNFLPDTKKGLFTHLFQHGNNLYDNYEVTT